MAHSERTSTVKQRLWLLAGSLMAFMIVAQIINSRSSEQLSQNARQLAEVDLPAVRTMTLVDMMHDGLRAVAYRALSLRSQDLSAEGGAVREELGEMTANIQKYLATLDGLALSPETKNLIAQAKPSVESYVQHVKILVELVLAGDKGGARSHVPALQKAFSELEASLEKVGEHIQKDARITQERSLEQSRRARQIALASLMLSCVLGLGLALWITRSLDTTLRAIIERLTRESSEVNETAAHLTQVSRTLSKSTNDQASALQQTAASAEEITSMVKKTSENAQRLEQAAQTSESAASTGQQALSTMLSAMSRISENNSQVGQQIEASNQQLTEIVGVIGEIETKTHVINDIVFQTKLLSFNASVEAARAGEHGKGFAVVAEEVGNLAQMSGRAAHDISAMLQASMQKVQGIVEDNRQRMQRTLQEGQQRIEAGNTTAAQCGQSLAQIIQQVGEVNSLVAEITGAIREQSQGVSEITRAVHLLDRSNQGNVTTADQTTNTSTHLLDQAEQLNDIVRTLERIVGGASHAIRAAETSSEALAEPIASHQRAA